jgi:hypothetical protein
MTAKTERQIPSNPYFVWVMGSTGPEPQKWGELNYGVNNRLMKDPRPIGGPLHTPIKITPAEYLLDMDVLVKLYPCPAYFD